MGRAYGGRLFTDDRVAVVESPATHSLRPAHGLHRTSGTLTLPQRHCWSESVNLRIASRRGRGRREHESDHGDQRHEHWDRRLCDTVRSTHHRDSRLTDRTRLTNQTRTSSPRSWTLPHGEDTGRCRVTARRWSHHAERQKSGRRKRYRTKQTNPTAPKTAAKSCSTQPQRVNATVTETGSLSIARATRGCRPR
jgi:hypothetical protein